MSVTRSRNGSMCSILLRHRTDPNTSAPRSRAYSARWLPTKPVIPVIRTRIPFIVLHSLRRAFHTRGAAKRTPPGSRQRPGCERPEGEDDAPPRIDAASHRAPAHSRLGLETVGIAHRRDTTGSEPPDYEGLGQVRQARDARQT